MSRELCLRFFVYILVFILCQKTGNFFYIFFVIFFLDFIENKPGDISKI